MKYRYWTLVLLAVLVLVGWYVLGKSTFKLGLDLAGGTQLTYRADTSKITDDIPGAMESLKDVIERRVNLFGVSEPVVQIEGANAFSSENKLIVELPGVTNVEDAIRQIGLTPTLEFRLVKENIATTTASSTIDDISQATGLTGRYLARAILEFNQTTGEPVVSLQFNDEGSQLFADITKNNINRILAIFLDGEVISSPVIREQIPNGKAQISGMFTAQEARTLVRSLNYGALPVPIELVGTETVGPSLGGSAVNAGITAGIVSFILVGIFLIAWYRLPGVIATAALLLYVALSLAAFKLIPVTLTAAGIAGFILSMGMAVDANILIFERMKEELRRGRSLTDAIHEGFHRAWLSIRDSNISSLITALVLFWLGTSAVKGFAFTFGLGVLISMFTAITVSRTFLFALPQKGESKLSKFLFGSGFKNNN